MYPIPNIRFSTEDYREEYNKARLKIVTDGIKSDQPADNLHAQRLRYRCLNAATSALGYAEKSGLEMYNFKHSGRLPAEVTNDAEERQNAMFMVTKNNLNTALNGKYDKSQHILTNALRAKTLLDQEILLSGIKANFDSLGTEMQGDIRTSFARAWPKPAKPAPKG